MTNRFDEIARDLTIFYADDDKDDREVFTDALSDIDRNLSVVTHEDAEELLHAMHHPPPTPNVLFLDLNMPGKNGFDVLKEIRQNSTFDEVPVVILSTSSDAETVARCRQLGANYYIPKATDFEELKKAIYHTLKLDWGSFRPGPGEFFYKN
ncbi:MAG: response regulator [Flavipsychrobacter sp.]|nr:response regulator [Flavipsychrobacter sp.]